MSHHISNQVCFRDWDCIGSCHVTDWHTFWTSPIKMIKISELLFYQREAVAGSVWVLVTLWQVEQNKTEFLDCTYLPGLSRCDDVERLEEQLSPFPLRKVSSRSRGQKRWQERLMSVVAVVVGRRGRMIVHGRRAKVYSSFGGVLARRRRRAIWKGQRKKNPVKLVSNPKLHLSFKGQVSHSRHFW